MSFNIATASFMVEILLAELILLFPAEKRSLFWLRYPLAFVLCVLIGAYFPLKYDAGIWAQFLLFLLLFLVSVGAMWACFKIAFSDLFSRCVAGYAIEHISYHIVKIALYFGFLSSYTGTFVPARTLAEWILFPGIYLLFFLTVGLYSRKTESYKRIDLRFNFLSFFIVFLCIGLTRIATFFGDSESVTVSFYAIIACGMALFVQLVLSKAVDLKHENDTIRYLWQEDRRKYELSKATIDTINIKYHDLKHKLHGMNLPPEEIESIREAMQIYGSQIETGNEALDVLLSEHSLRCMEQGITLTYTGNGSDFSFMNVMDVYSLFGNAVSNAVEAVSRLTDPEKKIIDILSERRGSFINITVSNYYSGKCEIKDGLPVTSKTDEEGYHGYGIRSMQLIAEKYGGSIHVSTEKDLFTLNIYLIQG